MRIRALLLIALLIVSHIGKTPVYAAEVVVNSYYITAVNDKYNEIAFSVGSKLRFYTTALVPKEIIDFGAGFGSVIALEYSHDQEKLAIINSRYSDGLKPGNNTDLRILDVKTRKTIYQLDNIAKAGSLSYSSIWNYDDTFLTVSINEGTLLYKQEKPGSTPRLHLNINTKNILLGHPKNTAPSVEWSPNQNLMIVGDFRKFSVVNADTLKTLFVFGDDKISKKAIWSPDGSKIAFYEGRYNPETKQEIGTLSIIDSKTFEVDRKLDPIPQWSYITWIPGSIIYVLSRDPVIVGVLDDKTLNLRYELKLRILPRQILSINQGSRFLIIDGEGIGLLTDTMRGNFIRNTNLRELQFP
jgi:hypothetical protein